MLRCVQSCQALRGKKQASLPIWLFRRQILQISAVAIVLWIVGNAPAQSTSQVLDSPQPAPHVDAGSLAEIAAHLKTVGTVPWTGMQGTGQITYGNDATSYDATLTILGNTGFRLDALAPNGQISIRINGIRGSIQEPDGKRHQILPVTAASGIVQFQVPRLGGFPAASSSLLDRGTVVVDGQNLHRLTFEVPLITSTSQSGNQQIITTDFYFDSTTHLLVRSANTIRINGVTNVDFLREITYADYRQVGSSMVPFRFTQTLNGQKQWTLQLSEVQLGATQTAAYFEF